MYLLWMKILIFLTVLISSIANFAQEGYVPKFAIPENEIELTRLAVPGQYLDRVGRKSALMGFESGTFEFWIWPWKVLNNFELLFFTGSSTTPIPAKNIVKEISVTPEAAVITFSYESFSVREIIFVPVNKPAAVILLDIQTTEPLSIVPGFFPVMQPQWPAGIGGQYSYWDEKIKAFIISESQQRGLFLCGSPSGNKMSAPPAHMFADNPLQFRINAIPEDASKGYIPIVIAGSPVKTKYDSVKILYNDILNNIPSLFEENVKYYNDLKNNTISIKTPVDKINKAFEWGKTGLHNLLVENPVLGKGLVAGYGLSGGGGRPGFAWFFGGDAFVNSLAINSFQDFSTVKDALLFTQKWQRQENFPIRKKSAAEKNTDVGKMAHELSQSEGLIDWWNDYHYGYNHADTSPWYLNAIGDYYRSSGDLNFIKDSWNSIKQAFRWCISKDSNNDGLMDLKGAGLGVLEFGSLVNIHNDIYTQALWTQGLKEIINMSGALNDQKTKNEAEEILKRAVPALEKIYWMDDSGFYSFGANQEGEQVHDKSIYSTSALFFKLMDEKKSISTLKKFNTSEMMTGWGVRNLSNKSGLYNPSNYNYGTVWPFTSYVIGTAEYNYKFGIQGYNILSSTIDNIFNYGLGVSPEVLSGDLNTKLAEAYHNQGFSYSGFMIPLMRGLMGIEADAVGNKIILSPNFPADWNEVEVKNIKIGENKISFTYNKNIDNIEMQILNFGEKKILLEFNPVLSPGTQVTAFTVNGKEHKFRTVGSSSFSGISAEIYLEGETGIELKFIPVPEIFLIPEKCPPGSINKSLIINSQEFVDNKLHIYVEIYGGKKYSLGILNTDKIMKITGAELKDNMLGFSSSDGNSGAYIPHEIIIEFRR